MKTYEQPKGRKIEIKDSYAIIKYPLSTEKSLRMMESENKLIFAVDKKATKAEIKKAVEEVFKAKVISVNTTITQDGVKRAFVKFSQETPAIDIATTMGLM
jgi:ribosomal protein uL23